MKVDLLKRCCQTCVIRHFNNMPINKVSVSRLLGEKTAPIFSVTEERTIEQAISEMNSQRVGSIVVKKGSSICGIFTEFDVLIRVASA